MALHHIKGNLTYDSNSYASGNGEGCFFLVEDDVKAAYDNDDEHGVYWGVLDNDSLYFIGLEHGERLPLEMRGKCRPVVPFGYLRDRYELNPEWFGESADTPQDAEEEADTVYYFDCLDGRIGDMYLTLDELNDRLSPEVPGSYNEAMAVKVARDIEATLYRCKVDGGEVVESVCLYDPFEW